MSKKITVAIIVLIVLGGLGYGIYYKINPSDQEKPKSQISTQKGVDISNVFGTKPKSPQTPQSNPLTPILDPKASIAQQKQAPNAQQLTMAVMARYMAIKSLRLVSLDKTTISRDGKVVKSSKTNREEFLYKKPGKYVFITENNRLFINKNSFVEYVPKAKLYSKSNKGVDLLKNMISSKTVLGNVGLVSGIDYRNSIEKVELLKDSKINGKDMFVLAIAYKPLKDKLGVITSSQKLWIDKSSLIIFKNDSIMIQHPKAPKGFKGKLPKEMKIAVSSTVEKVEVDSKIKDSKLVFRAPSGVKEFVPKKRVSPVNKTAPDFSYKVGDSAPMNLSSLKGKTVVLVIWQSKLSEKQLPEIQKLYNEYKDKIELVTISWDNDKKKLGDYFTQKNYTFPYALMTKEIAKTIMDKYEIPYYTATYIIDDKGVVKNELPGSPTEKSISLCLSKIGIK